LHRNARFEVTSDRKGVASLLAAHRNSADLGLDLVADGAGRKVTQLRRECR
jgi:hypothetical protein